MAHRHLPLLLATRGDPSNSPSPSPSPPPATSLPAALDAIQRLEAENARLKRMYADLSLTHHALQEVVAKKP